MKTIPVILLFLSLPAFAQFDRDYAGIATDLGVNVVSDQITNPIASQGAVGADQVAAMLSRSTQVCACQTLNPLAGVQVIKRYPGGDPADNDEDCQEYQNGWGSDHGGIAPRSVCSVVGLTGSAHVVTLDELRGEIAMLKAQIATLTRQPAPAPYQPSNPNRHYEPQPYTPQPNDDGWPRDNRTGNPIKEPKGGGH